MQTDALLTDAFEVSNANVSPSPDLRQLTAEIVAAYLAHNPVRPTGVPEVIASVHAALNDLVRARTDGASAVVEPATPAQILRSITADALISFLDGRSYKTLKRHLTGHGLDADGYRRRFGLPSDYPMVAASYAAHRSALAKQIGLGRWAKNVGTSADEDEAA